LKKKPLLRRLGASVSFVLLASALPVSASAAKHRPADPKPRQKTRNTQHGARIDSHRDPRDAHCEPHRESRREAHRDQHHDPHHDAHASWHADPKSRAARAAHFAEAASAREHASRFRQLGLASWYGRGFHGRKTANGEHYDMFAMTAAHRTLPLGSFVRVTSLATSRSVVVRINDRGPYARGRVIDLSYQAATALGMHRAGVTRVAIERVERPETERIAHRPMHLTTNG